MELTTTQREFVTNVTEGGSGIYVIRGYAGTGKTTTVSQLIKEGVFDQVLITAPTGAAVSVLNRKLAGLNADVYLKSMTLSSLTQNPVTVLRMFETDYRMDDKGYDLARQQLMNLGIWDDKMIVPETTYHRYGGDIEEMIVYIVNDMLIEDAIVSKFKNKSLFGGTRPEFDFREASSIARVMSQYDALVIDEMSMVDERMMNVVEEAVKLRIDLYPGTPFKVILAGDRGQLPPVEGTLNRFFLQDNPSNVCEVADLVDILRSTDNIAHTASLIRSNVPIQQVVDCDKESQFVTDTLETFTDKNPKLLKEVDIALAYTNKAVNHLNATIRQLKGFSGDRAEVGETLMVLSNVPTNGLGQTSLSNSDELYVTRVYTSKEAVDVFQTYSDRIRKSGYADMEVGLESSCFVVVGALNAGLLQMMDVVSKNGLSYTIITKGNLKDWRTPYDVKSAQQTLDTLLRLSEDEWIPFVNVTFGYARTIHKSQGSEWKRGLIWVTSRDLWIMKKSGTQHATSLLYTAYTRFQSTAHLMYAKN